MGLLTFEWMKITIYGLIFLLFIVILSSCRKDSFIDSPDALVNTSIDTLRFDTVFTTTGSVTHSFKIFNQNDQKLKLSNVRLMGGAASAYKINVDGSPGVSFSNLEIDPNDSLYVFVSVTVNPTTANLPFIIQDSVLINYNGNNKFVQLEAFGQNANFLRGRRISSNTTFDNSLPYVILDSLSVSSNTTLTINEGCRIYSHANAPIVINGTLKVNGKKYDSTRVTFQGDRLDPDYRDFPGSWPGIIFTASSKDNVLNYAVIKNAYQGIVTQLLQSNNNYKVTLNECIIDNIYDAGVLAINSSINARNCLISNCGNNVAIVAGGTYNFVHCTVATYSNAYLSHKNPVLFVTNALETQSLPLSANFRNCIFWGEGGIVDDEIALERKGTAAYNVVLENVLYKAKNNIVPAPIKSFQNVPPEFDSINTGRRIFDFHLKERSGAIDKGVNTGILRDLDDKLRTIPDIGCYEKQ
jgi:hypothetical protein